MYELTSAVMATTSSSNRLAFIATGQVLGVRRNQKIEAIGKASAPAPPFRWDHAPGPNGLVRAGAAVAVYPHQPRGSAAAVEAARGGRRGSLRSDQATRWPATAPRWCAWP
jgi:hypothetical protein